MGKYLMAEEFTNGRDGVIQFICNGEIIPVLGSSKFAATTTPKLASRGQIGTRTIQSKITTFENKIAMTADYYVVELIRSWLLEFKKTGKWPKIDMMAINEDQGTSMGRMSTSYKDLVLDGDVPLQMLDEATENGLTIDINFRFRDWDSLSEFNDPQGTGEE